MELLVVDDDPVILELCRKGIGEKDGSVTTAESVEEALKVAAH